MNGFLVVLTHTWGDLPLALCGSDDEARQVADQSDWKLANLASDIAKVLNVDCTTPVSISIISFEDGIPVDSDVVWEYEGESF